MTRPSLILAILVWLCLAGGAFAHASLVAASPAANSVLTAAPSELSLQFNEPVSPILLTLIDPAGTSVKLSDFTLLDTTVEIVAPPMIAGGTYVLSYRVISSDGHPVGGSIIFSIGMPSAETGLHAADPDWLLMTAIWSSKLVFYIGLFFGAGSRFIRAWMVPARTAAPRHENWLLIAGLVAAPVLLVLQGLDALGLPLSQVMRPDVWQAGLATSLGPSAVIGFASLFLALLAEWAALALARILTAAGLVGIGLALAATGHAASADPQWLTRPAVFVHALAIAYWAGALPPLAALLRSPGPATRPALQRFSRAIPTVLALLVVAGSILAVVQVGSVAALAGTAYGRVLMAKLVLFAALLVLAAYNRWRLTRQVEQGDRAATRQLLRIVVIEIGLIFAIQGVAALWRFTPPPRAATVLVKAPPLEVHIHTDQMMAQLSLGSGGVGSTSVSIFPMTADFGALTPQAITLLISNPSTGIEPIKYAASPQADGSWLAQDVLFPVAGLWTLRLDVRVSDFQMISIQDEVQLAH